MYNVEKHIYHCLNVLARELLDPRSLNDHKSRDLSIGFKLSFDVLERAGFTTRLQFTTIDPEGDECTFIIQAYHQGFARVEQLKQRGRVICESRPNGIFKPELLAQLNESLSDYFDGLCFSDSKITWELVA